MVHKYNHILIPESESADRAMDSLHKLLNLIFLGYIQIKQIFLWYSDKHIYL